LTPKSRKEEHRLPKGGGWQTNKKKEEMKFMLPQEKVEPGRNAFVKRKAFTHRLGLESGRRNRTILLLAEFFFGRGAVLLLEGKT